MSVRLRKFFMVAAAAMIVFVVAVAAVKRYGDANYFMANDPSAPVAARVGDHAIIDEPADLFGVELERNFRRTYFDIEARPGDWAPCVLTQPVEFEGRLPTILFVHGAGENKRFVERLSSPFNQAGFNMVSWDQWGRGDRRVEGNQLAELRKWLDRGWKAVHEAQRLVDYLVTRDDVDPERLYLIGASYGSMVGAHVLAQDKRFGAGILVVGGGNFRIVADSPIFREEILARIHAGLNLAPIHAVIKPAFAWAGRAFDPIHSAPHTGPTPVLKQCGTADRLVPPESGIALYEALGEPKELRWYDIDHPGLRQDDGPEIIRLLDDGLVWLAGHAGIPSEDVTLSYPAVMAQLQEN